MGVWGFLTQLRGQWRYWRMLSGQTPVFSQFGEDIYASDVVQQAVACIVNECKKLQPMHIRRHGMDVEPVHGPVQAVLDAPNPLMTTSEMIEKIIWMRELNCNAFVLKSYTAGGDLAALWPLQPSNVEFRQYADGQMAVHFRFAGGYECDVPYDDVIHIRKNYAVNELMGGNASGQADNEPLLRTLRMNHALLEGTEKALKSSFAINGIVKYNTMMDKDKQIANVQELEKKLRSNDSGLMPMDLKSDFVQLKRDVKLIDAETLKFIDSKILRNYGVSLPILTGDFTSDQMAAFYQHALEPIIVGLNQAFTKGVFSRGERATRNEIAFYPEELMLMSTGQKLEMVRLLGDSGGLYENEKRTAFGLRPLPELVGKRLQSLNYVDTAIAREYQLRLNGGEKQDDEKQA